MRYSALTFDTSLVVQKSFNFETGSLAQLYQFKGSGVQIVISSVVVAETRHRMIKRAEEAKHKVQSGLRDSVKAGLLNQDQVEAVLTHLHPHKVVDQQIQEFLDKMGAVVLPPSVMKDRMDELMHRYDSNHPPFKAGEKKSEFPDAVALMSLETWATTTRRPILAVTTDSDWESFARECNWIDVKNDLGQAISLLVADAKADAQALLIYQALEDEGHDLHRAFHAGLRDALSSVQLEANYDSPTDAELEYTELDLVGFNIVEMNASEKLRVISVGEKQMAIQLHVAAEINATGVFDFSVWDSIDREAVSLGSQSFEREGETASLTVIAVFEGDFADLEDLEIEEVTIEDADGIIEFGYVEPYPYIPDDDETKDANSQDAGETADDGSARF